MKFQMPFEKTLLLLVLSTTLACSDAAPREEQPIGIPVPATPICSWNGGIKTIFEKQCGSCHPGTQQTDYKTFAGVKAGINAEMSRINDGTMPPGGMKAADKKLVTDWVAKGLPETDAEAGDCE